ncbi:hypothetical protein NLJ89_g5813 [Agrocybe chaxingu]|uniref:Brain protein I3 n=1 Tax=Agrocybe chaxingu TaxID=84603 RepID=A0A9W8K6Q6_9AGAR|nr:hypothetical protein NLJ89_g5813 [Agrocybe chaxingu]
MSKQPLLEDVPQENPPSYDYATDAGKLRPKDNTPPKGQENQPLIVPNIAGPSYTSQPLHTAPPTVYNYVNPITGERVVSLLPPGHPEMICLQAGAHIPHTEYGLLGILAAVFWFPLGIGLCLLDKRVRCKRCGLLIEDGLCS